MENVEIVSALVSVKPIKDTKKPIGGSKDSSSDKLLDEQIAKSMPQLTFDDKTRTIDYDKEADLGIAKPNWSTRKDLKAWAKVRDEKGMTEGPRDMKVIASMLRQRVWQGENLLERLGSVEVMEDGWIRTSYTPL